VAAALFVRFGALWLAFDFSSALRGGLWGRLILGLTHRQFGLPFDPALVGD